MRIYLKVFFVVLLILAFNFLLAKLHWTLPATDEKIMEIFFSLFGVIYAIIVGFAMYIVLDDYNEIKHYIHAEVNELQDLRDYLMWVDNQPKILQEIREKIKTYVEFIIFKDWPYMSKAQNADMDTPPEVYDLMKSINKIKPSNDSDVAALTRLIESIASLNNYRTDRLLSSHERLPGLIKHLIFILSLFIVFTFSLIPVSTFWVNMGLNALNSFGIAFIYFVIIDLDYPFSGVWCIKNEPYQQLLKRVESI